MTTVAPMLACGSLRFTTGDSILILSTLGLWLAAFILGGINFGLIFRSGKSKRFAFLHFCLTWVYIVPFLLLANGHLNLINSNVVIVAIYAIPGMTIAHFAYLFSGWRKERKLREQRDASATFVEPIDAN